MIKPEDYYIKTFIEYRHGGMHVGMPEMIIMVIHKATGLRAIGWGERSQHKNRDKAIEELERMLDLQNVTREEE